MTPRKFHIIGNGTGEITTPPSNDFKKIYFNSQLSGTEPRTLDSILIQSTRQKKDIHGGFQVSYLPDLDFAFGLEQKLNKTAFDLQPQLHAWPSSGIVLIQSLFENAECLLIDRIGLDPHIRVSNNENTRIAAPSAHHNWIAERRYAFSIIKNKPSAKYAWHSLLSTHSSIGFLDLAHPYNLFEDGFKNQDLNLIKKAISASYKHWQQELEQPEIFNSLEKKLYLQRGERLSPNWWLFSIQGSLLADSLSKLLRYHLNLQYLAEVN